MPPRRPARRLPPREKLLADLPSPAERLRVPDPAVARALAQLCADHDGYYRRPRPCLFDDLAARLPAGHLAAHDPVAASIAARSARPILAAEYGVAFGEARNGHGRRFVIVRLLDPGDRQAVE